MLYAEKTIQAMKIAFDAHRGQTDKAGIDYVNHPLHLAESMDTEAETCAVSGLRRIIGGQPDSREGEARRSHAQQRPDPPAHGDARGSRSTREIPEGHEDSGRATLECAWLLMSGS